jgi:hypothetical protein
MLPSTSKLATKFACEQVLASARLLLDSNTKHEFVVVVVVAHMSSTQMSTCRTDGNVRLSASSETPCAASCCYTPHPLVPSEAAAQNEAARRLEAVESGCKQAISFSDVVDLRPSRMNLRRKAQWIRHSAEEGGVGGRADSMSGNRL